MAPTTDHGFPQDISPDQYAIERELGRGGMATVYLARDTKHGRRVALKVLRSELAASLGAERFRREITLASNLQHPHIVSVYDSGETPSGVLWAVELECPTTLFATLFLRSEFGTRFPANASCYGCTLDGVTRSK